MRHDAAEPFISAAFLRVYDVLFSGRIRGKLVLLGCGPRPGSQRSRPKLHLTGSSRLQSLMRFPRGSRPR